jgi:hypothetical protein
MSDILAIDPGPTQSGYAQLRGLKVINTGVMPNHSMLDYARNFCRAIDIIEPRVAIEQIRNMGMIVGQEVFYTVFWTGRIFEHCLHWSTTPELIPRIQIKLHLCGNARAKDANVRQALIDRFGAPGTKKAPGGTYGVKSHAWSALAVAAYAMDHPA